MRRRERDPATTAYRFALDPEKDDFRDVRIPTERGEVLDYTVLYLTIVAGRLMPVERFDVAHGYPHRDTLDWDGHVVEKHWLPLETLNNAVRNAIMDVKSQWPRYLDAFLDGRPKR